MIGPRKLPRLLRVVHFPGCPTDIGVVVSPAPGVYEVLWNDGCADMIDRFGLLDRTFGEPLKRPPTVTRDPEQCSRLYLWAQTAFAMWGIYADPP